MTNRRRIGRNNTKREARPRVNYSPDRWKLGDGKSEAHYQLLECQRHQIRAGEGGSPEVPEGPQT